MQQEEKNKINQLSPAFPPQVAQDSLGRIFAAIPGMTKLEFFAIMIYSTTFKEMATDVDRYDYHEIIDASIDRAKLFLNVLNDIQNEETSSNIIK